MPRVLIIESDKLLAGNLRAYLEKLGHSVSWRCDPQSAVNSADKRRPDVVILDLVLAGHNGVEFLYEFRSYPEWLTVPIIIYSSVSPEDLSGAELAMADLTVGAYHHKPETSLAQLAASVERLATAPA